MTRVANAAQQSDSRILHDPNILQSDLEKLCAVVASLISSKQAVRVILPAHDPVKARGATQWSQLILDVPKEGFQPL
jgi:hypothetical protein